MQTLLLVEDGPENLRAMEYAASGADRRILKSSGRDEAIRVIQEELLDLVVTDLALHTPGQDRDGMDVLRAAKARDPEVPVILVSNYLSEKVADTALEEGAFDVINRADPNQSGSLLRLKIQQALRFRELLRRSH
jgi:CheY-like chemotaxis protein